MKTILIATDFSATSINAAKFAGLFAIQVKADIILCNAFAERIIMPEGNHGEMGHKRDFLSEESLKQLTGIKKQIEQLGDNAGFKPAIRCLNEVGAVTELVNKIISDEPIDLVVIGTHGTGGLVSFLLGNDSRIMIDEIDQPLMLVPPSAKLGFIKRIAFATDFKDKENDLESLYKLISWVRPLNAAILLTHIHEEEDHSVMFGERIKELMTEISTNANYPHISYRVFRKTGAESGLLWLAEHGEIDILAMQHRPHTFFDSLFRGSQSDVTNRQLPVPVLIFPSF